MEGHPGGRWELFEAWTGRSLMLFRRDRNSRQGMEPLQPRPIGLLKEGIKQRFLPSARPHLAVERLAWCGSSARPNSGERLPVERCPRLGGSSNSRRPAGGEGALGGGGVPGYPIYPSPCQTVAELPNRRPLPASARLIRASARRTRDRAHERLAPRRPSRGRASGYSQVGGAGAARARAC